MKLKINNFSRMKNRFVIFIFLVVSCARYSPELESALELAGDNRKELEKACPLTLGM